MSQSLDLSAIANERSWISSYPVGSQVFRGDIPLTVVSAGIDFLILKNPADGSSERVLRNTVESLQYFSVPRRATRS